MKASLFILCTILTVLQARKNSNYQAGKLDKNNHKTMISSNVDLEPEHIEDDEETLLKPKITVGYCPSHKNTPEKTRSITKKLDGANINRSTNIPRTAKKYVGRRTTTPITEKYRVDRKEDAEEDKEITLAKKVREFEREMREAKLAKGGDGGYNSAIYYDGNVSKGDDENGSSKLYGADVRRRTTTPITEIKVSGIKRLNGVNRIDRKEEVKEDNERTLSKKVREFEREMREAKLAKGGDGGYNSAIYYDGNVSKGDDENESGNNRFGKRSRNINKPNTRYDKSTNKNIWNDEGADGGKKVYVKPGYARPGGYGRKGGYGR